MYEYIETFGWLYIGEGVEETVFSTRFNNDITYGNGSFRFVTLSNPIS